MRKYTHASLLVSALLLPHSVGVAAPKVATTVKTSNVKASPLVLAKDRKALYTITVSSVDNPTERIAAQDLAMYLEQISGAKFIIKNDTEVAETAPQILVGATSRVKALLPQQNWAALGTDGIVIKTVGNKLILAGGQPRGTLYAVYSFLEDTLGVRWWTETESSIPQKSTIQISPQNLSYTPQILSRDVFYFAPGDRTVNDGPHPRFSAQLKLNGHHFQKLSGVFGGSGEFGGNHGNLFWSHSFIQLLPPEKYFKDHPEWYSDPGNGNKPSTSKTTMPQGHSWNLCLTNEAARLELTKQAIKSLHENPGYDMISIAQNDTPNYCTCDACTAVEKEEGSPSGPLLRFVNKVAEDIEKEFPGTKVETLAYLHTIKPPLKVRPRKNVLVTLSSIESDFARPLDSEANKVFHQQLLAWKKVAPQLRIWDYTTNFGNTILPHPNLRVLGPNMRLFAANNAVDVFEQGDAYSNGTGDFVSMRAWLLAHLMWNPSLNQRKLEDEFLNGYYGKAAPHLRAYLETIQDSFIKTGKPLGTFHRDLSWLTLDTMTTATKQFQAAAKAVAGDKVISERVRRERLALDHAWILRDEDLRKEAKARNISYPGPADLQAFVIDFVQTAIHFKAGKYDETNDFNPYATQLLARTEPPAPLPGFAQGKDKNDVIDIQERLFTFYQGGTEVKIVDDTKASNGRAAKIVGNSYHWVVQHALKQTDEFLKGGRWHCYAIVRVEAKAGAIEGPVVKLGIYDDKTKLGTEPASTVSLADVRDGEYQTIDLGVQEMHSKKVFWAQSSTRDDIDSIFVDRFLMIREP